MTLLDFFCSNRLFNPAFHNGLWVMCIPSRTMTVNCIPFMFTNFTLVLSHLQKKIILFKQIKILYHILYINFHRVYLHKHFYHHCPSLPYTICSLSCMYGSNGCCRFLTTFLLLSFNVRRVVYLLFQQQVCCHEFLPGIHHG